MSAWEVERSGLHTVVTQLQADLDYLERLVVHENLLERLRGVEAALVELSDAQHTLDSETTRTSAELADLAARLRRLDARVLWLERHVRMTQGVEVTELDDVDPEVRALATDAEAGHVARSALLPDDERTALKAAVTAHTEARESADAHRRTAVAAAAVLADTPYTSEPHRIAADTFRTAVASLATATAAVARGQEPAREGARRLAEDDALRERTAGALVRGERAWSDLRTRLRTAVAEAVGSAALLPSWFTTALGPIPPADDTDRWMEVATDLLAYRVTYGVTDPVVALGQEPRPEAGTRRRSWWRRLERSLTEMQR